MRRIVLITENHIEFVLETPGVEVIRLGHYCFYEDALYITDSKLAAQELIKAEVPWIWIGEFHPGARYCVQELNEVDEWFFFQAYSHMKNEAWCMLETDEFVIREITEQDLPAMYELYGKPGVKEFVEPLYEYEEELEFTRSYIESMYGFYGYGLWLAFEKKTGKLVGRLGFSHREIDGEEKVELGYIIDADCQGRGIAYKLCRELLEKAREYWHFTEIFICCDKNNARSIGLGQKLGFVYYGACDNQVLYRLVAC